MKQPENGIETWKVKRSPEELQNFVSARLGNLGLQSAGLTDELDLDELETA